MRLILWVVLGSCACSPMIYTHGVPNLAAVDGDYIYRSGQISSQEGWDYVKKLAHGRKVHVVKLNFDAEGTDQAAAPLGFELVYAPIQPEDDQDVSDDVWNIFQVPDAANIARAKEVLHYCKALPHDRLVLNDFEAPHSITR